MKVIIRDLESGRYLEGPACWGGNQNEAMGFENSIAALEFCVTEKLHNVEILLLLADSPTGVPLRLFPRADGVVFPGRRRPMDRANSRSRAVTQDVCPPRSRQESSLAQARSSP